MELYLPVAQLAVDGLWIFVIGAIGGVIGAAFGTGGGFFTQPMLIAWGVAPAVALTSLNVQAACNILMALMNAPGNPNVDYWLALVSMIGGFFGIQIGARAFQMLGSTGYLGILMPLVYVPVCSVLAFFMIRDGLSEIKSRYLGIFSIPSDAERLKPFAVLPYKIQFPVSGMRTSIFTPMIFSFLTGLVCVVTSLSASFVMIWIMSYLYRMQAKSAIPTALFYGEMHLIVSAIIFVLSSRGLDIVLTATIVCGGGLGAKLGRAISRNLRPDTLKLCLGIMMLLFLCRTMGEMLFAPYDRATIYDVRDNDRKLGYVQKNRG